MKTSERRPKEKSPQALRFAGEIQFKESWRRRIHYNLAHHASPLSFSNIRYRPSPYLIADSRQGQGDGKGITAFSSAKIRRGAMPSNAGQYRLQASAYEMAQYRSGGKR
jgi:hypothetical protein